MHARIYCVKCFPVRKKFALSSINYILLGIWYLVFIILLQENVVSGATCTFWDITASGKLLSIHTDLGFGIMCS